jgi:hypothetical protein
MNARIETLANALEDLSSEDLEELSIQELDRLECDLQAWGGMAMVAAMTKRAALGEEEPQ